MKKYFNLVVALVAMLFAGTSFAYAPPPAPANGWYIVDQTGKLSEADKAALNQKIDQVSKATKNEFGILLLNNMDGNNIEDVAYATFNTWGIGKRGLDNGVLIVVSLQERKTRIETGKGVGGEVTDLQAKQILDNTLRPFLKKGDFAGGFNATLDALGALIESRHNQATTPVSSRAVTDSYPANYPNTTASCALAAAGVGATDSGSGGLGWLVVLFGVGGFVVWRLRASSKRREAERRRLAREEEEAFEEQQRQNRREAQRREVERLENVARLERENTARLARERLERERLARETVTAPAHVAPTVSYTPDPPPMNNHRTVAQDIGIGVVAGAATGITAGALAAAAEKRAKERAESERREASEREARRKREREREEESRREREREEESRRRRQREEDDRRSSYSSSSSDSGFGGFGGSSGGGFDGGSSGGGGASSDW